MSHTQGPWSVAENLFGSTASYEVYSNVETKSGKGGYARICQITPRDQKANAHLIAAAPELLEALEGARWLIESYVADLEHSEEYQDVINAIKKARGEE